MTEFEHFARAPIVEALLDVATVSPASVNRELLASFQKKIRDRYPAREVRDVWKAEVEFRGAATPVARSSPDAVGYLFRSADGRQVVQARSNGFSFSRLKPYEDWASLRREARALWKEYVQLVKPTKVTRVALRFINRIELPMPVAEFKDYLLTGPELAPGLPQGMSNFFFRVAIPSESHKAVALITETIEAPSLSTGTLPLIFDIDVFREGTLSPSADAIWATLDELRDLKNRVFHGSITEKTKEMFR